MANKDINTFLNEYTTFRAKPDGKFQSNPGDTFIDLVGKTDLNQLEAKWSVVLKSKFNKKRYAFIKTAGKYLWLNIGGGKDPQGKDTTARSSGIMIKWDLLRVIKEMKLDAQTGILTLTVNKDANFWYFDSQNKVSPVDILNNFTGKLDFPNASTIKNMDSQSPIHPPTGLQDMSGPFA